MDEAGAVTMGFVAGKGEAGIVGRPFQPKRSRVGAPGSLYRTVTLVCLAPSMGGEGPSWSLGTKGLTPSMRWLTRARSKR